MEISGVISALVVGVVIGVLGRLVVPGRQHIGILWTVVVGIAAALSAPRSRGRRGSRTPPDRTGPSGRRRSCSRPSASPR